MRRSIVYTVTPNKCIMFIVYYANSNKTTVNSKLSYLEKEMFDMFMIGVIDKLTILLEYSVQ